MTVDEMRELMDQRFESLDARLDRIDARMEQAAETGTRVAALLDAHDRRRESEIGAIFTTLRERVQRGEFDELRAMVRAQSEQIATMRVSVGKLIVLVAMIAAAGGGTAGGVAQMILKSIG